MTLPATFLASLKEGAFAAETGVSWWQTLGGLVVVFGLLLVSLKLLGRWNRRSGAAQSALITVWPLGPKKEIQVLRLEDQVHYIYRHEGAMVVLQTEALADFEAKQGRRPELPARSRWRDSLNGRFSFRGRTPQAVLHSGNSPAAPGGG
jgi:hypothetical protein